MENRWDGMIDVYLALLLNSDHWRHRLLLLTLYDHRLIIVHSLLQRRLPNYLLGLGLQGLGLKC